MRNCREYTQSGLLESLERGVPLVETTTELQAALDLFPANMVLAGNTVWFDRLILRRHLPDVEARLHYRSIDVSTVNILASTWRPEVIDATPVKNLAHRALGDIRESIKELKHYRKSSFLNG